MASIQLKDLVPGKNYKVKVRAKHSGDDPSPWSKILNFKAPIKNQDDDNDTLKSKYGMVIGSKKDPKRGYIISSTFNGKITLKNGLVIDDDKGNDNIGTQGWAIDHKGNSIFNNIVARGQLIIDLNNNQGRMYFGENIPAFGTDRADGIKLDTYNYWFRTKSIADKRPSWRVGDSDSFVSYNPDSTSADGKLIVSGQIQAGTGTNNQVLLGANVGGSGIAGIKIDGSNFWYDADKVANNAVVFKVSGADTTGITVNKAGRVTINTDHSGGVFKGSIVIRDIESNRAGLDTIKIGQNVDGTNRDGIKFNSLNKWTLNNNGTDAIFQVGASGKTLTYDSASGLKIIGGDITLTSGGDISLSGGKIKTLDPNSYIQMDANQIIGVVSGTQKFRIGVDGSNTFEGTTNPTGGIVKGVLTVRLDKGSAADKFAIGQDVRASGQDGIVLNSNNYWTLQDGVGTSKTAYFKVGGPTKYILWDGADLTVSAQIQAGVGTNNTVLIGPDVGGSGIGGIKLDTNNFWYDPTKVTGTNTFFQVRSDNAQTSISVAKGGNVQINGEQVGGSVTGTINVTTGKLSIPFFTGKNILIGKNVSGSNDGISLDSNNYWYVASSDGSTFGFKLGTATKNLTFNGTALSLTGGNISLSNGGTFKTADSNTRVEMDSNGIYGYVNKNGTVTKTFWIDSVTGDSSFEGTTNPTGGTVKGKLTIQNTTYAFGKDVISAKDGLYINANNYWTLTQTGANAEISIGGASKYIKWDGTSLSVIGGDISLTGGGSVKTSAGTTRVEMSASGIFGYVAGTKTFWIDSATGDSSFEGTTNPTGGTIKGVLQTTNGFKIGKGVITLNAVDRDGIYLNANNYWSVGNNKTLIKVGDANQFISYDPDGGGANVGKLTIYGELNVISGSSGNVATTSQLSTKADATGGTILSLIQQSASGGMSGVEMGSAGYIRSSGKTYNSATAGWILEYNSGTPRFEIGSVSSNYLRWTGSALEVNGKVLAGSTIGSSNIVVNDPSIVNSGTTLNSITFKGTTTAISITPDVGGGQVLFTRGSAADGAVFSTYASKYADSANGAGIAIGNPSGYPFIEVGWSDTTRTIPKISLYTQSGVGLELRQNNFVLRGGSSSRIGGIPVLTSPTAGKKVLYGGATDALEWADAPSGGGAGSISLNVNAQDLLSYNNTTGVIGLPPPSATKMVFAGGGTNGRAGWRALISTDLPITAGTGITLGTNGNNMVINSTATSGYSNGAGTANLIQYGSAAGLPTIGRTAGDIYFVI